MALIDVIRCDAPADVMTWKHPNTELGLGTQLIVNESQEAVLFKGGQALDVFGPGRHTLATANLPILNSLINLPFGGKSPFQAEIWFVNRRAVLNVLWGTPTPIQLQDPKYGIMVPLGAHGRFGIRVSDSKRFLVKLVGTSESFDNDALADHFKGVYITLVTDALAKYFVTGKVGFLEISAHIRDLSDHLAAELKPTLDWYGVELINFMVNSISVPKDDPSSQRLRDSLSEKAWMDIVGTNFAEMSTYDILKGAATNQGTASTFTSVGVGAGLGVAVAEVIRRLIGDLTANLNPGGPPAPAPVPAPAQPSSQAPAITCGQCGVALDPTYRYCPNCSKPYNRCPNCCADIPVGASACPACGNPASTPCPGCGQPVKAGSRFCHNCGATMSKTCPNAACGAVSPATFIYCPYCSAAL